jgi:hypothetical protein
LFLAIANGPRHFRLCTVASPAILIFVWLLTLPIPALGTIRKLSWVLAGCYLLLLPVYRQVQWHGKLDLPIGRTAFTDRAVFQKFQWMAERTHPSDGFFNDSALTLYLSLHNPTQTEFVTYDETTRPEQIAAVLDALSAYGLWTVRESLLLHSIVGLLSNQGKMSALWFPLYPG